VSVFKITSCAPYDCDCPEVPGVCLTSRSSVLSIRMATVLDTPATAVLVCR
jgi:hypothetical protein